jgi:hypothetical protein
MPKRHTPSSAAFRAETVQLVRMSGTSKTTRAQELGISLEALRHWYARPNGMPASGMTG